jgi:hypothetical protein
MLGYLGHATLGTTTFLFTGGGVNKTRNRMDSGASFGGQTASGGSVGMGVPHQYDYPNYEGNLDFELDEGGSLLGILTAWINARNTARAFSVYPSTGASGTFANAYWSSIGISGSVGSLVTGSLSATGLTATITNGVVYPTPPSAGGVVTPVVFSLKPLLYWMTTVSLGDCINWSINFNQDVVKVFTCQGTSGTTEAAAPKYIAVGPLSGDLSVESLLNVATPGDKMSPSVTIGGTTLTFPDAELNNTNQPLKAGSDILSFPMQFQLYGFTTA